MARVIKPPRSQPRRRHYFREWRKLRKLSTERAAEQIGMSRENLGRMERGEIPYDQDWLERAANVYGCDPADLIARNPLDDEGPWRIWEKLAEAQRRQAIKLLKVLADEEGKDQAA